jgi:amidase
MSDQARPDATPLWQESATALAQRIRDREISAREAVTAAVERMRAVNPHLNAVVEDLGEVAIQRAEALDSAREAGAEPGPLHGVPVTIKINVDQRGHATSNGLPALKDAIAPDDAPLVRNLLDAGAVVIGRTNTPEFSFRAETDNPLFGRTRNPWGDHVSAGGSSGGAGSAVMAGMGPIAHGNDIGGSLRFPAAANGAVTVKPGMGRVPAWNPGQKAERGMLAQAMSVQGVITRNAADQALTLPVIFRGDPRDPFHVPLPYAGEKLDGPIRVAYVTETYEFPMHPDVARALDAARAALTDAGYIVEEAEPPLLREAAITGYSALMGEVAALMGPDIEAHGSPTLKMIFQEYFAQFPPFDGAAQLQAMADRTRFARAWSVFLAQYPLVLTPFLPHPFFRPNRDAEGAEGVREALGGAYYSFAMNFMGLPAGNMPTRLATLPQGPQPIGVQIVGRRWREDLIVEAMAAIEARIGTMDRLLWKRM